MQSRIVALDSLFPKVINAFHLPHLRILTSWLFDVSLPLNLTKNTLAVALTMLNNFLASRDIALGALQISGLGCLSLAAELCEAYSPQAELYVHFADNSFTLEDFSQRQVEIVNTLRGKIRPLTAMDVLAARLYEGGDEELLGHARGLAILLYIYYPKYFRLSPQAMADLCVLAGQALLKGATSEDVAREAISNLHAVQSTFSVHARKNLSATLELLNGSFPYKHNEIGEALVLTETNLDQNVYVEPECQELEFIAEGGFSTVHKVICDGRTLAVKKQDISQDALQELAILSTFQHENIIAIHRTYTSTKGIDLCMELGVSLYKLIRHKEQEEWSKVFLQGQVKEEALIPLKERRDYMLDICDGLVYLHSRGIIHLDLKPGNIIIVDGRAKIADFGRSLQGVLSDHDKSRREINVITEFYRPPELLFEPEKHDQYAFEVDIWSLGCIILELETGLTAFESPSSLDLPVGSDFLSYLLFEKRRDKIVLEMITQVLGTPPPDYYPNFPYQVQSTKTHLL